ncbi:hypothetical protein OHB26_16895 [Nocardia sp. NBC_01503]|uniref:hypothetical protein n=1 Tax=Nocardia sp. NBC_01503 TaxID=2975997 RepID=UPI002E7B9BF1|nr:hypothetical protein [Nocardia sp. NBC_01503]WTL35724.1 hypothetical protein OHB26_16895 [Nocardia sp. NBC_01503]
MTSNEGDGRPPIPNVSVTWWQRAGWKFWTLQIVGLIGWAVFVAGIVAAVQNERDLGTYRAEPHQQITATVTKILIREQLARPSSYELTVTATDDVSRIEFPRDNSIIRRAWSGMPVTLERWHRKTVAVNSSGARVLTTEAPAVALCLSLGYALGGAGFGLAGSTLWFLERDRTRYAPHREAICLALAFDAVVLLAAAILLLRDPLRESWFTRWGLSMSSAACVASVGIGLWRYHRSQRNPPGHGAHSAVR